MRLGHTHTCAYCIYVLYVSTAEMVANNYGISYNIYVPLNHMEAQMTLQSVYLTHLHKCTIHREEILYKDYNISSASTYL